METFIDSEQGRVEVLFSKFPDGDIHCEVPELDKLPNDVIVYHKMYPNQNEQIIKLTLLLDLLKNLQVCVFLPYLPYARQDKQVVFGEEISANMICRLLASFDVQELYTLDCHFIKNRRMELREGLLVHNIQAKPYLLKHVPDSTLIAPDAGAQHMADGNYFKKVRGDYVNQPTKYREIISLSANNAATERFMTIIDDIIGTGSTITLGAELLTELGVEKVYAVATHGFFFNGTKEISQYVAKIVTTDSIPNKFAKVKCEDIYTDAVKPLWITRLHSN